MGRAELLLGDLAQYDWQQLWPTTPRYTRKQRLETVTARKMRRIDSGIRGTPNGRSRCRWPVGSALLPMYAWPLIRCSDLAPIPTPLRIEAYCCPLSPKPSAIEPTLSAAQKSGKKAEQTLIKNPKPSGASKTLNLAKKVFMPPC